jgi:DNA-binding GntR family transcriptional regulator
MDAGPADHHTLSDTVYYRLRDAIVDRQLAPGRWLRQEAIAQEFGLSQMPVREALRRLVADGLAERIPYRGVRVVEITPEDVLDMVAVRQELEGLAVRYAAGRIGADELEHLKENLRESAGYREQHEMDRRRQLNTEFHRSLCRASGRRFLMHQLEALWRQFPSIMLYEGMRRQQALSPARLARETEEHWAIVRALEARDAAQAEAAVRHHVRNLAQEMAELLELEAWRSEDTAVS